MKYALYLLLFFNFYFSHSQVQLNLYSLDECNGMVKELKFSIDIMNNPNVEIDYDPLEIYDSKIDSIPVGTFLSIVYEIETLGQNQYSSVGLKTYEFEKEGVYRDTIVMPKIRYMSTKELHNSEDYYFNCSKLCNGDEIDFYTNGNKRLEGKFKKGKPKLITHFRQDGSKKRAELYNKKRFVPFKILYYNDNSELIKYEIRTSKGRKTIIKTYDKNKKLIKTEVINHIVLH